MTPDTAMEAEARLRAHPCFYSGAHRKFARMHLPVAPKCNIQCNYCDRKYDCTNESRPGVTSEVLTPEQAVEKIRYVKEKVPYLSVIGIAGPGDPLANEETFETLELMKKEFPEITFCLSTNGLNLPKNADRLKELGVRFVTVTMNAIDPEIGARLYDFVMFEGKAYHGEEAAKILIDNQLEGIRRATEAGITVKVNSVLVPGINMDHLPAVAKRAKELGAYIVNILPLIPVPGTKFESMRAPTSKERKQLQDECEVDIRQMRHCRQCRADAIGLLGEDRSAEFAHFTCATKERDIIMPPEQKSSYRIAVATSSGKGVDQHFGLTEVFRTYRFEDGKVVPGPSIDVTEEQEIPLFGPGHRTKIEATSDKLKGMDAVISTKFGLPAIELLKENGIEPIEDSGDLEAAVRKAVASIRGERASPSSPDQATAE